MEGRFITEEELERAVERWVAEGENGKAPRTPLMFRVQRWFRNRPPFPELISRQKAAEILGVQSPHLTRPWLADQITAVPVEGAAPVYVRAEIETLAKQRKRDAAAKERRRAKEKAA